MNKSVTIVVATRNKGKIEEITRLLEPFPVNIKNLDDFGPIPEIVEDGNTFEENAYKKASMTARFLGMPVLADDSGLVVEALDGAPGVHSARYAGEDATDEDRCKKLLEEMTGVENRNAAFKCVISIATPPGPALTYEADCKGLITEEPSGENGFGYDPVFYYPDLKKTFAEISIDEKSSVSHRGKALKEIQEEIDKIITWLRQNMPVQERFECQRDRQ
ncbi:MAG: XTP/dITP diphosphatase [Desulfobacterales bacterium]|nr:XTP/dITP diphosphatase [Desulfobacterales bacterium]